jgi:hypothetical protein
MQMVGAVDVGHGNRQLRAEHEPGGDLLRSLVDRAGRKHVAGAEGPQQRPQTELAGEVVDVRVPDVGRQGRAAVGGDHLRQAALHDGQGLLPGGLLMVAGPPQQGRADPVGISVEGLEGGAFRTQIAVAEHVVPVTPDAGHGRAPKGDLQAAARLAQRAGAKGETVGTVHARSMPGRHQPGRVSLG